MTTNSPPGGSDMVIGLDLGSSNSSVSVYRFGRPDVIANYLGERVTPSIVYFDPYSTLDPTTSDISEAILVGKSAGERALRFPQNVVFGAKRMIGRDYRDPIIQQDIGAWPYKVIESQGGNNNPQHVVADKGKPLVEVQHAKEDGDRTQSKTTYFTPEQIGGYILKDLIKTASEYLGEQVRKAVITVPANFNSLQRAATITAAQHAGIDVVKLLNEPTAAAFAYGFQSKLLGKGKQHVLIYDFGGGTLDVTLMYCENGIFKVLGTEGDTHLGGQDFDNELLTFCFKTFKQKTAIVPTFGKDKKSAQTLRKLRNDVERAKCDLSTAKETYVTMYYNGHEEVIDITRADLEHCCKGLFARCLKPVDTLLKRIKFDEKNIDEIILVGGSTRIPKVQQQLISYFSQFKNNTKTLSKSINPDEAVSIGASIQAAILSKCKHQEVIGDDGKSTLKIHDVIPLSIGLKTRQNTVDMVIPRNTILPVTNHFIEAPISSFYLEDGNNLVVLEGDLTLDENNNGNNNINGNNSPTNANNTPSSPSSDPSSSSSSSNNNNNGLIETLRIDISNILATCNNPNQIIKITLDIDINGTLKPTVAISNQATLPPPPPNNRIIPLTFHAMQYYLSLTAASTMNVAGAALNATGLGFLTNYTAQFTGKLEEFHIMFDNHYNLTTNKRQYAQILCRVINIKYNYYHEDIITNGSTIKQQKLDNVILSLIDGTGSYDLVIDIRNNNKKGATAAFNEKSLPSINDIITLYIKLTIDYQQSQIQYELFTFTLIQGCTTFKTTNDKNYVDLFLGQHLTNCKEHYLKYYLLKDQSLSDDILQDFVNDTPFDIIPIMIRDINTSIKPQDEYNLSKIYYNTVKDITHRLVRYHGVVIRIEPDCPEHRGSNGCCRITINQNGVMNNGISPKMDTLELHCHPDFNLLTPPNELGQVVTIVECIIPDKRYNIPQTALQHHKMNILTITMPNIIGSLKAEFTNLMNEQQIATNDYNNNYCLLKASIPRRLPPLRQIVPTTLHTFEHYLTNSTLVAKERNSIGSGLVAGLFGGGSSGNSSTSNNSSSTSSSNNNTSSSGSYTSLLNNASLAKDHVLYGIFDLTKNVKNYTKIRVRVCAVDIIKTTITLTVHDLTGYFILTFKDGELLPPATFSNNTQSSNQPQLDTTQLPNVGDVIDLYYEICISASDKPVAKYFHCLTIVQREPQATGPNGQRQRTGSLSTSTSFGGVGHHQRSGSVVGGRSPSVGPGNLGRSPSLGPNNYNNNNNNVNTLSPSIRDNIMNNSSQFGSSTGGGYGRTRGPSLGPGASIQNNNSTIFGTGSSGNTRPDHSVVRGNGGIGSPSVGNQQQQYQQQQQLPYRDYTLILLDYFKLCQRFYNNNNPGSIVYKQSQQQQDTNINKTSSSSSSSSSSSNNNANTNTNTLDNNASTHDDDDLISTLPNNNNNNNEHLKEIDYFSTNDNPFIIIPISYCDLINNINYDEKTHKVMLYNIKDISYRLIQYIEHVSDVDIPCPTCTAASDCSRVALGNAGDNNNKTTTNENKLYMHYHMAGLASRGRINIPDMFPIMLSNIHLITPALALKYNTEKKANNNTDIPINQLFNTSITLSKTAMEEDEDDTYFQQLLAQHYPGQKENHGMLFDKQTKEPIINPEQFYNYHKIEVKQFTAQCQSAYVASQQTRKSWGWW